MEDINAENVHQNPKKQSPAEKGGHEQKNSIDASIETSLLRKPEEDSISQDGTIEIFQAGSPRSQKQSTTSKLSRAENERFSISPKMARIEVTEDIQMGSSEKLLTSSILKQTTTTDTRKVKKSVDFTGINLEFGEELPVNESNQNTGNNGKNYRQKYLQKAQGPSSEQKNSVDAKLDSPSPARQSGRGHVRAKSMDLSSMVESDLQRDLLQRSPSKVQSRVFKKASGAEPNISFVSNPMASPKKSEKSSLLRTVSDETVCEKLLANDVESQKKSPEPSRYSGLDGRMLRSPSHSPSSSSLPFPPKHIRSQSLDSKLRPSSLVPTYFDQFNDTSKFEKPKVLPATPPYSPPTVDREQQASDDSTCEASKDSLLEKDFVEPNSLSTGQPGINHSVLDGLDVIQLKQDLDKMNEQYDRLRTTIEYEKVALREVWDKKHKEVQKDANSLALRKRALHRSQEKEKLEKDFISSQEALKKLHAFVNSNWFSDTNSKEKLRLRLASKGKAVLEYQKFLTQANSTKSTEAEKMALSSAERYQSLLKTHQQLCDLLSVQIQIQSSLISSEILNQIDDSNLDGPKCSTIKCHDCHKKLFNAKPVVKPPQFPSSELLNCNTRIAPDLLRDAIPQNFGGYLYKLEDNNEWKKVYLQLKRGSLTISVDEKSVSKPISVISCDGHMEIFDAPQAVFGTREHIFYLQYSDSCLESISLSSSCSTDNAVFNANADKVEKKKNSIYFSAKSLEEKSKWIDSLATAIHIYLSSNGIRSRSEETAESVIFQQDIWPTPFQRKLKLLVKYDPDTIVHDGNCVNISQILDKPPRISFETALTGFNAILMVDLDAAKNRALQNPYSSAIQTSLQQAQEKEEVFLHWAVLNVSGADISTGTEVCNTICVFF